MQAVDRAAARDAHPAHARLQLLARLQIANNCYPNDLTPEQLDELIARTQLLPPTATGGFGTRFYTDTTCWVGAANIGDPGTSRPAQLTYSFPDDGVQWGLICSGYQPGPNDLGSKLQTAYAGSLDRGREFIRSSIAAWRTVTSNTYTEVADDNSPEDLSTTHVNTRGDIRIGGWGFAAVGGPLAYNAFPGNGTSSCSGGDMTINTNYFTSVYFDNTIGNFLYFRNTVAHEHGHGLGFIHSVPCNQTKLMEPTIHTGVTLLSPDEVRAAIRNYGDRYSGLNNHYAANAKDYGNLTSPTIRSVIERDLGVNGTAVVINTAPPQFLPEDDFFKFTIGSTQSVTISAAPTGYTVGAGACAGASNDPDWCEGQQTTSCSGNIAAIDAQKAGNLALELRASDGMTVVASSNSATLGVTETVTQPALAAGTYYVRIWDAGGANMANQIVQTYDLTIRVGTSKAPPLAIAGLNVKRVPSDTLAYFIGNHNSYATEVGATLPSANFAWDLDGDGLFDAAASGQTQPTITYRSNGTYTVTLKVTDTNGLSATDTVQVIVYGATTTVTTTSPNVGAMGATVPIAINGSNFKGVTNAAQVVVSGGGISVTGTPIVNPLGTRITGLSLAISPTAAATARDITINNSDGQGSTGTGSAVFTVTTTATTGACCAADGSCTVTTPAACSTSFQPLGTVCSPNTCPQPGIACCDGSGICSLVSAASCTSSGGTAMGTVCSPNPCPAGACCYGSTCSVTSPGSCTGANPQLRRRNRDRLQCHRGNPHDTPCCKANFNQNATLEVQDIFDYLNAWFSLSPAADFNGGGISVQDIFDFLSAWFTGC